MKIHRMFFFVSVALVALVACSGGPGTPDVAGDVVDVLQELPVDTVVPVDVIAIDRLEDRIEDVPPDVTTDTAGTDTAIEPGKFGSPCLQNSDCEDGFCVEGIDGLVCTKPCVTECPDDWLCRAVLIGGDLMSLCVPGGVYMCRACTKNAQCADGLCIPIGDDGNYCTRECSELMPCPSNYQCDMVTDPESGNQFSQCVPVNGSCTCRAANDQEERVCENQNVFGTCLGYQTCNKDTGWTECTGLEPSIEVCDGIDNDCNRVADDNPVIPEGDCFNTVEGVGSCGGAWVCRGESGWDCVGDIPEAETCNYIDDDCDGDTDEDFKGDSGELTDLHNCGQCGVDCDGLIPFAAETACSEADGEPECVVVSCVTGYVKIDEHTCRAALSSVCVPCEQDTDCGPSGIDKCLPLGGGSYCGRDCTGSGPYGPTCPNGYVCNDFGADVYQCVPLSGTCECTMASDGIKRLCEISNPAGTCQGTEVCDGSVGWVNCTARTPAAEICDGIDNDCDGLEDNDAVVPVQPCEILWTDPDTMLEYSCTADWQCVVTPDGKDWVCPAKTPSAETCNNIDDNCDGRVDEDFKLADTNKYNHIDHCGACNVSCVGMVPHATMVCDASGEQSQCIVESCDDGWWKASDLSCLPFPQSLCMACASDAACQIPGDVCLPADSAGNSYCLWDCSDDALRPELDPELKTCPEGYHCRETNDFGQPLFKCFPDSGACDCIAGDDDKTRACIVSNESGRCFGEQTCVPASGWTVCDARTPAVETCNGQDDDCNGLVDEAFPSLGASCAVGTGECQRSGLNICIQDGSGVICDAVEAQGSVELCDGLDNDCDTLFDEEFPDLGKVCFVGSGECRASGFHECLIDGSDTFCNAVEGIGTAEVCDQKDNDCDGLIDEDWASKGRVCEVGVGECFATGVWVCSVDTSGIVCDGVEGTAVDEVCDGLDNDCDIEIDELWPEKNTVCVVGEGACRQTGVFRCMVDKSGIECSAVEGTPSEEICDGIDNDCDGEIDETWPNLGRSCQEGAGECLDIGVWVCTPDMSGIECSATEGSAVDELCDGLDNDCDGAIDEVWPEKGTVCQSGAGVCQANGVFICTADFLDVECDAAEGTPVDELCDGLDNDCDTLYDEDFPAKGAVCFEGVGACQRSGTMNCTSDGLGLECSAVQGDTAQEECDGIDNDCDGSTDEDFPLKDTVCTVGEGQCVATGTWLCNQARDGVECSAVEGDPTVETCDYLDNDCDGFTDQNFMQDGKYYLDTACGNCFTDCVSIYDLPQASGICNSVGVPVCEMVCDTDYHDLNGVPDDGCEFYLDPTAIYVSQDDMMALDDAACGLAPSVIGNGQYPCRSIQHGIGRSVLSGRKNVLVSNGLYSESVVVTGGNAPNGVNLKGGYRSDTWERDVATTLTTIRGATGVGHIAAVTFDTVPSATMLEGFIVQGASATGTGANSYAVYVNDCTSTLQILNNIVYGGVGGPGSAGQNGDSGDGGQAGLQGVATRPINIGTGTLCWGNPDNGYLGNLGGAGGPMTCDNYGGGTTVVSGGEGGFTSCPSQGRQEGSTTPDATPGSGWAGSGPSAGSGGAGGYGFNSSGGTCYYVAGTTPSPGNGSDASSGTSGTGGPGTANAVGAVASGHWAGSNGGTGTSGSHGSGGGGGGGGAGNNIGSTTTDDFGGGGGGGGSGGCGGFPGTGGAAGGGSFGIFVTFSGIGPTNLSQMPVLVGNLVSRGLGGKGGNGGNGGTGGPGGSGGLGGPIGTYNGPLACIFAGGKGGNGGAGGHAGGGGGGAGGVSWDIFVNNTNSISTGYDAMNGFMISAATVTSGAGGTGGLSSNTTDGAGGNGVAGEFGNLRAIP